MQKIGQSSGLPSTPGVNLTILGILLTKISCFATRHRRANEAVESRYKGPSVLIQNVEVSVGEDVRDTS